MQTIHSWQFPLRIPTLVPTSTPSEISAELILVAASMTSLYVIDWKGPSLYLCPRHGSSPNSFTEFSKRPFRVVHPLNS